MKGTSSITLLIDQPLTMIADHPNALEVWLTSIFEPLCDADPAALGRYVYALLKKEKPGKDLRTVLLEQLDVFLQQDTKPFVNRLFRAFETKEHSIFMDKYKYIKEPSDPMDGVAETSSGDNKVASPQPHPCNEQTLVKVMPVGLLEEAQMTRQQWLQNEHEREISRQNYSREPRAGEHAKPSAHEPYPKSRKKSWSSSSAHSSYSNPSTSPVSFSSISNGSSPRSRTGSDEEQEETSRDREVRQMSSHARDEISKRAPSRDRSPIRNMHAADRRPASRCCRYFKDRGFCLYGDMCKFDHSQDPVILEDTPATPARPPRTQEYDPVHPEMWPFKQRQKTKFKVRASTRQYHPTPKKPQQRPPLRELPQYPQHVSRHNNCSLEVKRIPHGLNEIAHLNGHFMKFGKIVNIQVCFGGDPEAALITFSSSVEASVAYKSTEAVLNNRFIKVFWHNPDYKKSLAQDAMTNQLKQDKLVHPESKHKVYINKDVLKQRNERKTQARDPKEGEDVSELKKRRDVLRREMSAPASASYGFAPWRARPYHNPYRYSSAGNRGGRNNPMRYVRPTATQTHVNQSIDHRPRALVISGFEADDADDVIGYFRKFGDFVGQDMDISVPELTLEYRVRAHAECAMHYGKNNCDHTLSIIWSHRPVTPITVAIDNDVQKSDMCFIRRSPLSEFDFKSSTLVGTANSPIAVVGKGSPTAGTMAPIGATTTPNAGTTSPIGATTTPNAGTMSPIGATSTPNAGTMSPIGATSTPNAGTMSPTGAINSPNAGSISPIRAIRSPNAGMMFPIGATSTPNAEMSLPIPSADSDEDYLSILDLDSEVMIVSSRTEADPLAENG